MNFQPNSFEKVFIESTVATECFVKRDIEVDNERQWNSLKNNCAIEVFFFIYFTDVSCIFYRIYTRCKKK